MLVLLACLKQMAQESLLLDSHEYLKKAHNLFNNWNAENVPQERYLEPFRRTIGYPFLLKMVHYSHVFVYFFQAFISILIPVFLHKFSVKNAFFSNQWKWIMLCLITYPLQFFYSAMIMPEILVQFGLLLMVVFYFEGHWRRIPILLSLLILLKPVFLTFLLFPVVLAVFKRYTLSLIDLMPIAIVLIISGLHFKQYGVFEYSSVGYTNAYDYNRKKFMIQKFGESFTDSLYQTEVVTELKNHTDNSEFLVSFFKSKTTPILLDPIYWYVHLKGFFVVFADPGRYDAMVFLNWQKTSGFMGINDGNAQNTRPMYQWIYIVLFALVGIIKIFFAIFAVFHWRKYSEFKLLLLMIVVLAFMAGPVGSARYLLPVYPIVSILSGIGILTFKNYQLK